MHDGQDLHTAGEVILWKYGSSPESDEDVTNPRDLDLGLNVSILTFLGLSSKKACAVSVDGLRPSLVYSIQCVVYVVSIELTAALAISTEWSNPPLFDPGGLEVLDGPEPEKILIGPPVVNALWRFAIAGTLWISAPKNTFRPP
ncbi:hypothetical protein AgCh_039403 [Apium graveolens]